MIRPDMQNEMTKGFLFTPLVKNGTSKMLGLLHGTAQGRAHNERQTSKIAPTMAPKDNRAQDDAALCNAGLLN